jgi:predicted nucleic acid-binding protein
VNGAVVIDTNVVVAGLPLLGNALPVATILRGMLDAAFPYVASAPLLAEYRDVLARPAIRRLHGLADAELGALLDALARHATVVDPARAAVAATPAPDRGDQMLWDLLATRRDLRLVTADRRLLRDRTMRGRVISGEAFLAGAS